MEQIVELVIGGIPVAFVIFLIVEEIKAYGVEGKILRALSLLIGLVFAIAAQLADGLPTDYAGWLGVVIVGLIYGLMASGGYDFLKARWAKLS